MRTGPAARLTAMRPVVLIGHADYETFGVAPETLRDRGLPWIEHLAHTGATLPRLSEISGIVLYGGIMNVDMTDEYPFLEQEREYVRAALASGVPYLGICLGGQLLARALDHPVYSAGVREIGFNALHPTPAAADDPLLSVFDDGDMVFHWHEDTFDLPEGATLLATGGLVRTQAFRYGDAAWGTQFHLEVDRAEIDLWLQVAGEDGLRAWGTTTQAVAAETEAFIDHHEERARTLFGRFWDVVRRRSEAAASA
jgi:GMP synthase (glutamine-hydrolysing)